MKRVFFIGLALSVVMVLCGSIVISNLSAKESPAQSKTDETMCVPMGSIILKAPNGYEPKRAPVEFPHAVHFSYSCQECHHTWKGDEKIKNCTTSGCHSLLETPKKPNQGGIDKEKAHLFFKTAYHKSCIGCHKKVKAENTKMEKRASFNSKDINIQNVGPIRCNECHPVEEAY